MPDVKMLQSSIERCINDAKSHIVLREEKSGGTSSDSSPTVELYNDGQCQSNTITELYNAGFRVDELYNVGFHIFQLPRL